MIPDSCLKTIFNKAVVLIALIFCIVQVPAQPVKIIFDTDFALDVDDAGALAILHHLADLGECEILGIVVSSSADSYDGKWAVPCIDAINEWYGRKNIPIGVFRGINPIKNDSSKYIKQVQAAFPHQIKSGTDVMEGYKLYRKILSQQPDSSVIIVSVGFLNNLEKLLQSGPDSISKLTGKELVSRKVREWSCMGGSYPDGKEEFNLATYPQASAYVLKNWPGKATFGGFELGSKVWSGAILNKLYRKEQNPVAMCFYCRDKYANNQSWDELQVLYAVRGLSSYFSAVHGWNTNYYIVPFGKSSALGRSYTNWRIDPHGRHSYLVPKASYAELQEVLDQMMSAKPMRK